MSKLLFGFGIFCIVATVVPFLRSQEWYIRFFDFPHAQLTLLTFLCFAGSLYYFPLSETRTLIFLGLLAAALIYQCSVIFPYTPISSKQVLPVTQINSDAGIKLISSNVLIENRDSSRILHQITVEQPDVVIILEADDWWTEQMQVLKKEYPYFVEEPIDNAYGMLLYSRLKLIHPKVKYLVEDDIPSVHTLVELPCGLHVRLYGVHPTPPSPTENPHSTERDAELLIVAKDVVKKDIPTIVIGDLNDVAWSTTTRLFQKISGLLDPRIGRGFFNTFNAKSYIFRWPLDHVFHSDHFKLVEMKRLPYVGSDHFPIYINLQYENGAEIEQEEPVATQEDQQEAKEKIEKVQ